LNAKIQTIWLLVLILLVACTAGINFVKPPDDKLVLGSTTRYDIVKLLGDPTSKDIKASNGVNIIIFTYAYANVVGESIFQDVTPSRVLTLYFYNNTLVGKGYTSSFKSDNTYFNTQKAKSIAQGMTKQQVINLLGNTSGEYKFPLITNKNGKALVYTFAQSKGSRTLENSLIVALDENNIVQKSDFNQFNNAAQ